MDIKAVVEKGAKWLDENKPGWVNNINLSTLDLSRGRLCVLGQVYGMCYPEALQAIHPTEENYVVRERWGRNFGFDAESSSLYYDLTEEWKRVIQERINGRSTRLATEAVEDVMFEGSVNIGGTVINLPPTSLSYLTLLVEANR